MKTATGEEVGCSATHAEAVKHLAALYANMKESLSAEERLEVEQILAGFTLLQESGSPSDYLIVGDSKDETTWHLPVKKNGKPDHTLMGAAWAALHGGYRGNKYEGPDKSEALSKLKALYKSEKMPLPISESDAGTDEHIAESAEGITPLSSDGSKWEVNVLKFGKSKTKPHYVYTRENMEANIGVFDGARIYSNSRSDRAGHLSDPNKKVPRDVVGVTTNPRITDTGIIAEANILPAAGWLRSNLLHLNKLKRLDVLQLSIDGAGFVQPEMYNGERLPVVKKLAQLDIDVVPRGAAGGGFSKILESLPYPHFNSQKSSHSSQGATMKLKQKIALLFTLLYPQALLESDLDIVGIDENELWTKLLEADKPQGRMHLPDGAQLSEEVVDDVLKAIQEAKPSKKAAGSDDPAKKRDEAAKAAEIKQLQEAMEAMQTSFQSNLISAKLAESELPQALKDHVRKQFTGADGKLRRFTEAEIVTAIKDTRETYAKFTQKYPVHITASAGMDSSDKLMKAIELFFLNNNVHPLTADEKKKYEGIAPLRSFREAYVSLTGDENVSGLFAEPSRRISESFVVADLPKVLGENINKALVREYNLQDLATWRPLVNVIPLKDFKTQHRIRYGGYGNLPTVGQRAPYLPLSSPTDEEATYLPAKRGGTEDITREMILNDDVGFIASIPRRMARAAAQTLHEFVYDLIRPGVNPTIYDSVALYHATNPTAQPHANLGSAALDSTSFPAARLRMKKQANKDNLKRLGIRARYLIVPPDLEQAAYQLVTSAFNKNNAVPEFYQQIGVMPIVVDYWTDTNDWVLAADPADVQGIELGFIGGQEDPSTFISDLPNVGSMFTNDVLTFKIRHEYGSTIIDYRAFDGSIV
jgi:hypothetical protein